MASPDRTSAATADKARAEQADARVAFHPYILVFIVINGFIQRG